MEINKIKKAAEMAKSKTSDKRWIAAINKAVAAVENNTWIVTELAHSVAITTESGNTYFANGSCQCKAYTLGQACKHRALARLIEIANELSRAEASASRCDVIIAEIKSLFAEKFPTASLTDTVCAMFGPYSLHHLGKHNLTTLLAAIAA
jgi:hypothetical protein